MFTLFTTFMDVARHDFPSFYNQPVIGPFICAGFTSSIGWAAAWPLERIKNAKQARYVFDGVDSRNVGSYRVFKLILKRDGIRGVFRGIGPGMMRSSLANGTAMVAMDAVQTHLWANENVENQIKQK
jgi:solute carrier family 25 carnitine/acylcarnitine transporter 20/29